MKKNICTPCCIVYIVQNYKKQTGTQQYLYNRYGDNMISKLLGQQYQMTITQHKRSTNIGKLLGQQYKMTGWHFEKYVHELTAPANWLSTSDLYNE